MRLTLTARSRLELSRALRLTKEALEILDELHAPGEIGATLDLAASKLHNLLSQDQTETEVQALIGQLERELNAGSARLPST